MLEVESEILSSAIDCENYHTYAPEYGYRAWKAKGKKIDVVYWDVGNGWCAIIDIIPHKKTDAVEVGRFYKKLRKLITESYDDDGFRIA